MKEEKDLLQTKEMAWQLLTADNRTLNPIKCVKKALIKPLLLLIFIQFFFRNDVSAQQSSDSTVSIVKYHYCLIEESSGSISFEFGSNKSYNKQIDTYSLRWESIVTVLNRMNELGWELTNAFDDRGRVWVLRKRVGIPKLD